MMLGLSLSLSNPSTGGGGSTVPAWVESERAPSGDLPNGVIDLKNGQYWITAVGVVALGDVCIQNLDWGTFDPGTYLFPGSGLSTSPALSGSAFVLAPALANALLVDGFTYAITVKVGDNGNPNDIYAGVEYDALPSYSTEYSAYFEGTTNGGAHSHPAIFASNQVDGPFENAGQSFTMAGTYKLAATLLKAAGDQVWAIDGIPEVTITTTVVPSPVPNFITVEASNFDGADVGVNFLEKVVFWLPQPAADVIALSTL